jgi:acyl carrier protein
VTRGALRSRLAELVEAASDGEVTAADALAPRASLSDLGIGSLEFVRLIDILESEYGIEVDLGGEADLMDSVDALEAYLKRHGVDDTGTAHQQSS